LCYNVQSCVYIRQVNGGTRWRGYHSVC
jgi:hypothetical protein